MLLVILADHLKKVLNVDLFNPELDTDEVYKRFVLKSDIYAPEFDKEGKKERYAIVKK